MIHRDFSVQTAYAATSMNGIAAATSTFPTYLYIPSIHLTAPIEPVGIDATGAMAVPPGTSNAVGWYEYGTIPGQRGSAVIDAHVFAS